MSKSKITSIRQKVVKKVDGWVNAITGLGLLTKDKRLGAKIEAGFLDQITLDSLYQSDDVAAKIVDRLPEDMFREGYEIKIETDDETLEAKILEVIKNLGVDEKLESAVKDSRLYGGSGVIIGIEGDDPEEELNLKKVNGIEYLVALDRWNLSVGSAIQTDVTKPNYGMPEFYQINPEGGSPIKVHHSRVIRFDGVTLPSRLRASNQYWGDSVLSRIYNTLRNYHSSHDSTAAIMQDFSQGVFKLENLAEMVAEGDGDLLVERMKIVDMARSVLNAIVLDKNEDFERKTTPVTGLSEILKIANDRLVAATDMPHTLLLGESPSGLGATGDSEKIDWYDNVKNKQESILRPRLKKIIDLIMASKNGPTQGKMLDYTLEFIPLWQMDLKEKIEIRKTQAEMDQIYVNLGVLDPDEITRNRFGNGEYDHETKVDLEERETFQQSQEDAETIRLLEEKVNLLQKANGGNPEEV